MQRLRVFEPPKEISGLKAGISFLAFDISQAFENIVRSPLYVQFSAWMGQIRNGGASSIVPLAKRAFLSIKAQIDQIRASFSSDGSRQSFDERVKARMPDFVAAAEKFKDE